MANFVSSVDILQDLTVQGGCVTFTNAATDIDLIDNNASALSFDSSGKTGILELVTTNCSEGVKMSGTLNVTGQLTAQGGIITSGCIILTAAATNVNLIDCNANALSFDTSGKADILKVITTSCAEGVSMSGYLNVECITTTGGLDITANGANLDVNTNGQLNLASSYGGGSAIVISAQCCGLAQVRINSTGTGSGIDAGGAAAAIRLCASNGGIRAVTGINEAGAIYLAPNAGTSETIQILSDQGTGTDSICIKSDAGGITLHPGTFVTVGGNATNAGEVRILEDTDNGSNYVALKAPNVSTSYTITLPTAVAAASCYVLTSTCAGVTSWAAASGGASLSLVVALS